jgi:hypothetical protein
LSRIHLTQGDIVSKIKQMGQRLTFAGILAGTALTVPGAARAQAKVELSPFIGSFYPLAKMCTDCGNDASNVRGRLTNSAAIGARVSYSVSRTMGIEVSGAFTPSRVELSAQDTTGFAIAASAKGTALLASGRVLFRPARTNLFFIVGGGIVHRGGDQWKLQHDSVGTKLTSVAGILGLGVRAAVTPKFALLVSAEANLYSFDPKLGPTGDESNGSKLQSDLLVTIGIPLTLSH